MLYIKEIKLILYYLLITWVIIYLIYYHYSDQVLFLILNNLFSEFYLVSSNIFDLFLLKLQLSFLYSILILSWYKIKFYLTFISSSKLQFHYLFLNNSYIFLLSSWVFWQLFWHLILNHSFEFFLFLNSTSNMMFLLELNLLYLFKFYILFISLINLLFCLILLIFLVCIKIFISYKLFFKFYFIYPLIIFIFMILTPPDILSLLLPFIILINITEIFKYYFLLKLNFN